MSKYSTDFINIKLSFKTAYVYTVRVLLQRALEANLSWFRGVLVDLGCGEMPYRQFLLDHNKKIQRYVGIDLPHSDYHKDVKPGLFWNGKKIGLQNSSVDIVMATELFEHLQNLPQVLKEIYRILKFKGRLFFTVPFVWPLHETPHDEFRYTPFSLMRLINNAGFRRIKIFPLGGNNASLAQMLCIWIANSPPRYGHNVRNYFFRTFEKCLLYPIIEKLIKSDVTNQSQAFKENSMTPGFYGYAEK